MGKSMNADPTDQSREGWGDAEAALSAYKGKWGSEEGKDAKAQADDAIPYCEDCEGHDGDSYAKGK